MDLNSEEKAMRELSTPDFDEIGCFGFGLDGSALFSTDEGIFRTENISGAADFSGTPWPQIETGYMRFVQGNKFQQIKAIALNYRLTGARARIIVKGYPSGASTTVAEAAGETQGTMLRRFDLSADLPKDISHAVKIETIGGDYKHSHPSDFAINALQLLVQEVDGTI
jgi:hypothetical protein